MASESENGRLELIDYVIKFINMKRQSILEEKRLCEMKISQLNEILCEMEEKRNVILGDDDDN